MFYTWLQGAKLQVVHPSFDQRVDSFFQKIEKRQLIAAPGLVRQIDQRNRDWRRRRPEIRNDLLVADRLEDVLNGFSELAKCDHALVVPQMQIERDAFGDMLGQPPARITRLVGCSIDCSMQPIAVELKELA